MMGNIFQWTEEDNLRQDFTTTGHLPNNGGVICIKGVNVMPLLSQEHQREDCKKLQSASKQIPVQGRC